MENIIDLILTALRREEEPKRVPTFVQGIMPNFFAAFDRKYGDTLEEEDVLTTPLKDFTLHVNMGFDSTWCGFQGFGWKSEPGFDQFLKKKNQELLSEEERNNHFYINTTGGLYHSGELMGNPHNFLVGGVIKTEEQWKEWFVDHHWELTSEPPNTISNFNSTLKQATQYSKNPILPFPTCGLIMEPIIAMLSMSAISHFARKKPAFLRQVIEFIVKPKIKTVELMVESDAPIIMIPDDCAYKGRPTLSPKDYKEFIIPHFKKIIDMAHRKDKLVVFHSDGYVEPYYNDLIEAGLDVHQSLEPTAGNDLGVLKEKYGDKLSFIGNMDCSILLPFGTVEEVVEETKKILKAGMPGGGFMFSPCTDLTDSCKLENAEAMLEVVKKYGVYSK